LSLFARLVIAMVSLVLLTATLVGLLTYRNLEEAILPRALERVETHTRLLAAELESYARGARADVLGFRSAVALEGIVRAHLAGGTDPVDGTTEATWRERMAMRYVAELKSKPAYSQFRIIGFENGGREIVRVERSPASGEVRVVPESELVARGDRDYVTKPAGLAAGEVYVSPVDLSQEDGKIVVPHVPTLRVATPIHAAGKPFGVVIINVDMRPIFQRLASLTRPGASLYVVNQRGDYLFHPNQDRVFGFEFGKTFLWRTDFPDLAASVGSAEEATLVYRDEGGERGAAALITAHLAGATPVSVIQTVPNAVIMSPANAIQQSTVIAGSVAALIAGLLAVLLARSLTLPLVQMTRAVENFAGNAPVALRTNTGGEIGVLTRAFSEMSRTVRDKNAALELEIAERRRIFDTTLDLILVADSQGNFLQISPSCKTILGYAPDEMIGHNAIGFIFPADLDATRNEMRSARRGRQTSNFECRYVHKDGHPVLLQWTGVWLEEVRRHYFIGRDMTETQRAQELVQRETEERKRLYDILSNTINSMVDAVLVSGVTGNVVISNPAAERLMGIVSGLTPEEWVKPNEVIGPDGATLSLEERPLMRAARGELVENFAMSVRHRESNKMSYVIANGGPMRDGNGRITGAVVVYRDVTESREIERQLQQAQKMEAVGQLTGGVAHDFNNILTVITGTIEIVAEGVADRPDLAAIAAMIDEAATRGADLTQRLLAFARRQPLQPAEIDINALVVETVKLLRSTLGEQVEIETMLAGNLNAALVDPNQLSSALINLSLNARDAMPNGGKLMLETMNVHLDENYTKATKDVQPGSYILVAVSDTGEGIPADIHDRVFEPFFTTKDVGRGTGLGLSMVYGFTKQSNGHIKIYSEVGHGTTIKLYLPQAAGEAHPQQGLAVRPVESGSESILAVEDDALVRNYVVAQLKSLGYAVLTAANADEALKIIDGGKAIDLLFTDVIMPGSMNGRQLSDEALKRRPSLKVLFTSGYTENAIVHHGRLDPGVLLLAKPYRKADLARMIRQALGDHRSA
jgi:PAS domain S-box-containing protein